MLNAAQNSMLVEVLNDWAMSPDWSSKARYVPRLSAAAQSLVRAGLVEVYEEHIGPGETTLLFIDEALEVLGNHDNWWREENRASTPTTKDNNPDITFYSLVITDEGRAVLRTHGDDSRSAWRDH